jgi:glycosyltransferase involved in cell wall biosynthesis
VRRLLYLSADPGVPVLGHKGASVHMRELASALVEEGADLHIASPRVESAENPLPAGVRTHPLGCVLPKAHPQDSTLRAALDAQTREIVNLARALDIEAIYERSSLFGAGGVRAADCLGLPHALEVNAPLCEEASRFRTLPHPGLANELEAEALTRTDRIFAVSSALAAILVELGADAGRVQVQPNGVSAERFPAPDRDAERFRAGFAGSLKAWHGVETLIEAVARVPAVHLEVVGSGPLEGLLSQLPPDRVRHHGALAHDEVPALMARWDVGLAPFAPAERFWFSPLKILEYMAAGSCVVASDLGDAAAVLGGGERGVLVPPGDAGALAGALEDLLTRREHCRVLGERARAWVRANRRWSSNAERVMRALGMARPRAAAA